jgi:hypothetical protein
LNLLNHTKFRLKTLFLKKSDLNQQTFQLTKLAIMNGIKLKLPTKKSNWKVSKRLMHEWNQTRYRNWRKRFKNLKKYSKKLLNVRFPKSKRNRCQSKQLLLTQNVKFIQKLQKNNQRSRNDLDNLWSLTSTSRELASEAWLCTTKPFSNLSMILVRVVNTVKPLEKSWKILQSNFSLDS